MGNPSVRNPAEMDRDELVETLAETTMQTARYMAADARCRGVGEPQSPQDYIETCAAGEIAALSTRIVSAYGYIPLKSAVEDRANDKLEGTLLKTEDLEHAIFVLDEAGERLQDNGQADEAATVSDASSLLEEYQEEFAYNS